MSKGTLERQIILAKLPHPTPEHAFAKPRRWRFDLAWPGRKLAVEIEGGVRTNGRHTRGSGYVKDLEKYNRAALDGWMLLRVTHQQIKSGEALLLVEQAMAVTDATLGV